jgi:general secretion pathway protein A
MIRRMYTSFFGLTEKPFAITPDPRYLYLSGRHAEALAHLLYGIEDAGGFVQLTGEIGTGKTTMVRSLLGQVPAHAEVALILNPRVTPLEFLQAICDELHLVVNESQRTSVKALVDVLNEHLLAAHAQGRRVVIVVDEAQQLSIDVLEQVRLLTNLETATQKLLQIILVGQPELRELVARPELRQLAQRITGRYHLDPLPGDETAAYVRHRLRVAGATNEIFTPGALREAHRLSQGIPRIINVIADRALLGAYTKDVHRVTGSLVRRAASEVYDRPLSAGWVWWATGAAAVIGCALLGLGLWQALKGPPAAPIAARAPIQAAPAAPAPRPSLDSFLTAHAADTGTDQAFATLFGLWKASVAASEGRPCEQATTQGLECFAEKGTLAQLRQLNRPAVITLVGTDGAERQVVLTALDDQRARLLAGQEHFDAELGELSREWFGDFLILWRPPVPLARPLKLGMRGDSVRWLRQSLAQASGEQESHASDVYDGDLEKRVEDFQRQHRLTVDGIAGVQTLVMLDAIAGAPGAPTLTLAGG